MSTPSPEQIVMCPICLETMKIPIIQCARGHSMCELCIKGFGITSCPTCRGPLSQIRNYQLEQLIEGMKKVFKFNCVFAAKGCKYAVSSENKDAHELECRYRTFQCEGKKFANWPCKWSGNYSEIYKHFKDCHKDNARMEYKTECNIKISFLSDFHDIQIISFFNGSNFFYYKHKVDKSKQKAYWIFQLIGLKSQEKHFFYEFEVHNGLRKFKVTEFCSSDTNNIDELFNEERCVVMSFATIKNYLDEHGELPCKFRIMSNNKKVIHN